MIAKLDRTPRTITQSNTTKQIKHPAGATATEPLPLNNINE